MVVAFLPGDFFAFPLGAVDALDLCPGGGGGPGHSPALLFLHVLAHLSGDVGHDILIHQLAVLLVLVGGDRGAGELAVEPTDGSALGPGGAGAGQLHKVVRADLPGLHLLADVGGLVPALLPRLVPALFSAVDDLALALRGGGALPLVLRGADLGRRLQDAVPLLLLKALCVVGLHALLLGHLLAVSVGSVGHHGDLDDGARQAGLCGRVLLVHVGALLVPDRGALLLVGGDGVWDLDGLADLPGLVPALLLPDHLAGRDPGPGGAGQNTQQDNKLHA